MCGRISQLPGVQGRHHRDKCSSDLLRRLLKHRSWSRIYGPGKAQVFLCTFKRCIDFEVFRSGVRKSFPFLLNCSNCCAELKCQCLVQPWDNSPCFLCFSRSTCWAIASSPPPFGEWIYLGLDCRTLACRWKGQLAHSPTTPLSSCHLQLFTCDSQFSFSSTLGCHGILQGTSRFEGKICSALGIPSEISLNACLMYFFCICCTSQENGCNASYCRERTRNRESSLSQPRKCPSCPGGGPVLFWISPFWSADLFRLCSHRRNSRYF